MKNINEFLLRESKPKIIECIKDYIVDVNKDSNSRIQEFMSCLIDTIQYYLDDIEDSQKQPLSYKFDPEKYNENYNNWINLKEKLEKI